MLVAENIRRIIILVVGVLLNTVLCIVDEGEQLVNGVKAYKQDSHATQNRPNQGAIVHLTLAQLQLKGLLVKVE